MACPVCHEDRAELRAITRGEGETCLMLQCSSCPAVYPLHPQSQCPNLEAFTEIVDEDFRDFLHETLAVNEFCLASSADAHELCPHYYAGTCPFKTSICQALLGGAVLFPRSPARILLTKPRRGVAAQAPFRGTARRQVISPLIKHELVPSPPPDLPLFSPRTHA
jgi:hypothetical protein